MRSKQVLTADHLRGLKNHKYNAKGTSISEVFMQPFWRWLVNQVPLWVAPNLLTFSGLLVNLVTSLAVILSDMNGMGNSPGWVYLICGLGLFAYQALDGIDGKQARRTGTNNQLGELFDHGCDAISTFLVALAGASAAGLNEYPYLMLTFVMLMELINYIYHWQTYVSGCLYFKKVDCTEAQFCHIGVMITVFIFGTEIWKELMPGFGLPLKYFLLGGVVLPTVINFISASIVILTQGKGKNGSTVADTSVLSPIIPASILIILTIYYAINSPNKMLDNEAMTFLVAMVGPFIKFTIYMMIAGMCKMPMPLFDSIMLGPLIIVGNTFIGCIIPEYYLLLGVTFYLIYDLIAFCIVIVNQVCNYLEVSCFTIPYPSMTSPKTTPTN